MTRHVSTCIEEIAEWVRSHGVPVDLFATDLPSEVMGRYDDDPPRIRLNMWSIGPDAQFALAVLAHEAGHWIGQILHPVAHSYQAERQAMGYGWRVLRLFNAPVSRGEWILHHDREYRDERLRPRDSIDMQPYPYAREIRWPPHPKTHRSDGWPLCPNCGKDEAYSLEVPANPEKLAGCHLCGWRPHIRTDALAGNARR